MGQGQLELLLLKLRNCNLSRPRWDIFLRVTLHLSTSIFLCKYQNLKLFDVFWGIRIVILKFAWAQY